MGREGRIKKEEEEEKERVKAKRMELQEGGLEERGKGCAAREGEKE